MPGLTSIESERRNTVYLEGMTWAIPLYSRERVNQAGREFVNADADAITRATARGVIDNWRSAHGFPLNTVQNVLRQRSLRIDPTATIAQRTKRLPSIRQKLERFPDMRLARMHDIAGCRAILNSVDDVRAVEAFYTQPRPRSRNGLARDPYDYIEHPKSDGYRGVHLVIKYNGTGRSAVYSDMRVEVQLRTRVQHAWATALETVDTFTRQALKSDAGEPEWQRFFALMGSELALLEGCPPVEGMPESRDDLRSEIAALVDDLHVVDRLQAYKVSADLVGADQTTPGGYYLLSLDFDDRKLRYKHFRNLAEAETAYASLEGGEDRAHPLDNVLVGVDSVATLRRAYPNYFLDTTTFIGYLRAAMEA